MIATRKNIDSTELSARIHALRKQFPIFSQTVNGKTLVYLDSAATTQKPESVILAESDFYREYNSNVHRGIHHLSDLATRAFEATREKVRKTLNAKSEREIIFSSGTTAAINLVASSFCQKYVKTGDQILVSEMEHHANLVPWQIHSAIHGATVVKIPITDTGEIDLDAFSKLLSEKVKLVAVSHTSNALGTINPLESMISKAHSFGIPVLVDGAQAIQHSQVNVQALDCDFFVFSGHKVFGPTGTGILYGKEKWLEAMPPWQGGGEMIDSVSFSGTTWNSLPHKFEAGTPNIAGFIGLGAALDFITHTGYEVLASQEKLLMDALPQAVLAIEGSKIIGTALNKTGLVSFLVEGTHPSDLGMMLNEMGIAVRTGHHCAQPVMERFGISGTCRASFSFYNTLEEIEQFGEGLKKAVKMLR